MTEFDLHAAIHKLAEAECKCSTCDGKGAHTGLLNPATRNWSTCEGCGGTGHIVPFVALRLTCFSYECVESQRLGGHTHPISSGCWRPEPDVERACWKIIKAQAQRHAWDDVVDIPSATAEEAVIRAALAWLEEQHDETRLSFK